MEITNELLKQAVADAEAVRDTAIANAKLALEESITPALKSMLAKRLRAELDKEETEGGQHGHGSDKEVELEPKEKPEANTVGKKVTEVDYESSDIGTGDNVAGKGHDSSEIGQEGDEAPSDQPEDGWYDEWDESDFDLDEIIKELEGEMSEDSLVEKEDEGSHEAGHAQPEGGKKSPATVEAPKGEEEKEEEGEEDKKLDLEAIIRELVAEAEDEDDDEEGEDEDDSESKEKMATEIANLKAELAEHREAVTLLSGKLQEVNLLNTKLLYTNKLFQKGKLTNEQSIRVLESFDRAKTLREVKMVYALMVENLKAVRTEEKIPSRKKVVAEGLASRAIPSTAPKKEQLNEDTSAIKRIQFLAGITA